ncbi:MAG TPA: metallopeptidase TldD-related protein, partial [Myxococcota bacterium]|nr:metallopeptidase TldD-related protein [Myxococcota bacterium]
MAEELSSRIAEVLEMAQKAGAREAWASIGRSREVETLVRDGEVEKVQESTSRALNLELWMDNRYASHRTTDLRPDALSRFVADAVALTRALQPDPDRRIPDPAFFAGRSTANLDLEDAGVTQIDAAQRESWCRAMDEAARRHERVISASSAAAHNESEGAAASTNGFSGIWRSTVVSLSADVTVRDEGDRRPEGSMWTVARHMGDLPNVAGIGSRALEEGLARIGSQKLPSLKGVLVVDPRAAGRLISALLGGADGRAVQQGRSVWAKKAGQKLFPERVSLTD